MTTIVITGGHHNSALVVAEELQKKGVQVVWIGHKYASRSDKNTSAEYQEVSEQDISFHDLQAGRFTSSLKELLLVPLGFVQAYSLLSKIRPDAILTFGGYIGAAVSLASITLGIPIYLHEQTVTAGLANKLTARLAKRIYLTWPSSAKHFDKSKAKVVGLPLRKSILNPKIKQFFTRRKPTLLVMGGKQGAHVINQLIFKNIHDILTHYNVIHQTGTTSETGDYEQAIKLRNRLGSFADAYLPLGYIGQSEIGSYLHSANLYLGRSGAHITYELAVLGIPAILIPYMYTHDREQYQNALYLESKGLGKIILQERMSLKVIMTLLKHQQKNKTAPIELPTNSSAQLVTDLLKDLRGH